jgi:hypothetical protein
MASWKKIVVSGSNAELAQITASGLSAAEVVFTGTGGALTGSGGLTYTHSTEQLTATKIVNDSAVADSRLTGSFSGSFRGEYLNSDGSALETEWDGTRNGDAEITGSLIISASEAQGGGQLNVTGTVSGSALGASNLGNTRVIFAGANGTLTSDSNFKFTTSTDKLEAPHVSSTSLTASSGILADGFDVLTTQDITIFTNVGDSVLEIGAATTTVNIPGDLIELGNGVGDIVDIKGDLRVAGTSSFNHSTNLSVADKYILLNSGSSGANSDSGGIVIQGPNQNVGQLFGFVSGSSINGTGLNRRWGIANNFNAETSGDFTADAFMATVAVDTADSNPLATAYDIYAKPGNIYSGNDGEIYIYAQ